MSHGEDESNTEMIPEFRVILKPMVVVILAATIVSFRRRMGK